MTLIAPKEELRKHAEAIGRAYARSIGKRYPVPPDVVGPGLQPERPQDYYQKYYSEIKPPDRRRELPERIELDATSRRFVGRDIVLTNGEIIVVKPVATRTEITARYAEQLTRGEVPADATVADAPVRVR